MSEETPKPGVMSFEKLCHFRCKACNRWWTLSGALKGRRQWWCPWCGTNQTYGEPLDEDLTEQGLDEASEETPQQVFTVSEVAEITDLHEETVRRHCRDGNIKGAGGGQGSPYRISRPELLRWWRQRGGGQLFGEEE